MFDFIKKKMIVSRLQDEILYEYVLDEMETGTKARGLWAKAIAHSDGNDSKATSLYMQFRVQSIKDEFTALQMVYEEMSKSAILDYLNKTTSSGQKTETDFDKKDSSKVRDSVEIIEIPKSKQTEFVKDYAIRKGYSLSDTPDNDELLLNTIKNNGYTFLSKACVKCNHTQDNYVLTTFKFEAILSKAGRVTKVFVAY